jgi:RNA polymerase sigma-70 factor (ECF subfamily)
MDDGDRQGHERRWHAAVLAGDDAAWRAGYDAAYSSVRVYIHWRCAGLGDLVDDVVQETWLTAVRRIGDYRAERGSFATWVCGIAGNVVRNALRNRRRRSARVEALVGDPPSPSNESDREEQAERTAQALAELPEHYERALRDKYLLGWSMAAMADHRGESVKAVESMLTRAREAFRQTYEQRGRDDG